MNNYAISLSSATYKNHIFEGFSRLQQNDEFVDMTLAAEGHWVKVHRMLVALASPYFRELLQSLPCQHPVMYLYGVSHEALGFILEYLYTGQVEVPAEKIQSFLNTASDMQIAGLKNVELPNGNEPLNQKHVFQNIRQSTPSARDYNTKNNEKNTFQLHAPTIMTSVARNDQNDCSLLPTNVPTVQGNTFPNHNNVEGQGKGNNVILEDTLATYDDSNKKTQNIELQHINSDSNMINISLNEFGPSNDLDPSTATNDGNTQMLMSSVSQTFSNINATGKMINITLDESANSDNIFQKPVANIEILCNTLINNSANLNMSEQDESTQLYTQPSTNMNNLNTIISPTFDTETVKSAGSSLMDISQLLDFRHDVPMHDNKKSSLLDIQTQSRNIESIDLVDNGNQMDNIVQQDKDSDSMAYTISNRGALQLILNRFMYYCHYKRDNGRLRRWRCIDYRDLKCFAAIDTNGEDIVARKNKHCHPNHEKKIARKMAQKKEMFSTIQSAQDIFKEAKCNK